MSLEKNKFKCKKKQQYVIIINQGLVYYIIAEALYFGHKREYCLVPFDLFYKTNTQHVKKWEGITS